MPRVGLEPTHLAAGDFESPASTNFATWAGVEMAHYTDVAKLVKQIVSSKIGFVVFYMDFFVWR